MHAITMVPVATLPGGPPPGVSPRLLAVPANTLAVHLGMSPAGMTRLIKRHRRELRMHGPILMGPRRDEFFLTTDQCDLIVLLSETPSGVAERACLMTAAVLAHVGLNPSDPALPEFKSPGEARRFLASGAFAL